MEREKERRAGKGKGILIQGTCIKYKKGMYEFLWPHGPECVWTLANLLLRPRLVFQVLYILLLLSHNWEPFMFSLSNLTIVYNFHLSNKILNSYIHIENHTFKQLKKIKKKYKKFQVQRTKTTY